MRVTIVSHTGYGLGLVPFLSSEGHNITSIVGKIEQLTTLPDYAIFDTASYGVPVRWTEQNVKVLGASVWSRLVETDDDYKDTVARAIGYKLADEKTEGTTVDVSCVFNGHTYISKALIFNYSKLIAGGMGATVKSSGYLACFNVENSRLITDMLGPLERFLRKANHRGCFSVSCVVNKDGVFVKDIGASIDTPHIQALIENTRCSKSDLLLSMFDPASRVIETTDNYVCGVMLSLHPFPSIPSPQPVAIVGLLPANLKHMWTIDISRAGDTWECPNVSGCLGYVTARGVSVKEAMRRAYRTISNISAEGMQYRSDVGKDVNKRLSQLRRLHML